MSRKKKDPIMMYPVSYSQLEPGDAGYDEGHRYMIEQVDGDRHFFRSRDGVHGSDRFAAIHSMKPITLQEMATLRKIHAANRDTEID